MLMSVKLQILKSKFPEELFQITMNHLNGLLDILIKHDEKGNEDVIFIVRESIAYVNSVLIPY